MILAGGVFCKNLIRTDGFPGFSLKNHVLGLNRKHRGLLESWSNPLDI